MIDACSNLGARIDQYVIIIIIIMMTNNADDLGVWNADVGESTRR